MLNLFDSYVYIDNTNYTTDGTNYTYTGYAADGSTVTLSSGETQLADSGLYTYNTDLTVAAGNKVAADKFSAGIAVEFDSTGNYIKNAAGRWVYVADADVCEMAGEFVKGATVTIVLDGNNVAAVWVTKEAPEA